MMFDHYSKENGLDIYENKRHGFGYVFNGKFDGEHKGVWITHVEEKDMVTPIKEPVWWSAGTTAVNLACQQGFKEIYLMGFDLSANPLNNMYLEGKKEQMPSDPEDFCERLDWANQLKNTFESKPKWQRALIMLGGPLANFVLAIFIFSLIFFFTPDPNLTPVISKIDPENTIVSSELKELDEITAFNGKSVSSPTPPNSACLNGILLAS